MNIKKQIGSTITDALFSMFVLSVGTLGVIKYTSYANRTAVLDKQRAEAILLAQEKVESFRRFSTTDTTSGFTAYDDISTGSDTVTGESAVFTRNWTVTTNTNPNYKTIATTVAWTASDDSSQSYSLSASIGRSQPIQSGELYTNYSSALIPNSVEAEETPPENVIHENVPEDATDNGDGTSTWTANDGSAAVLTFDNSTGEVLKVNGATAFTLTGTISNAPAPGDSANVAMDTEITLSSASDDSRYCSYAAASSSSASYTCYVESGWSGNLLLSATSVSINAKVCFATGGQPFSPVTSDQIQQDFVLFKSIKPCSSGLTTIQSAIN